MSTPEEDVPHRNLDADEQAFWDRVFHQECEDANRRLLQGIHGWGSLEEIVAMADESVEFRRRRTPPKSDWEAIAGVYERSHAELRRALGISEDAEHEEVLAEIAELRRKASC